MATGDVATQPYSFRDRENAQRLTKNTWKREGKKKILKFLTTLNGYKRPRFCLKAEVGQIKTQPWPFQNCLPLLEISSFIDKDDFWSIVKLVANTQQPSQPARCSSCPLLFRRGWRSAESHQCRIDQPSWKMPVFPAPRAAGLRSQPPARSAASACCRESRPPS